MNDETIRTRQQVLLSALEARIEKYQEKLKDIHCTGDMRDATKMYLAQAMEMKTELTGAPFYVLRQTLKDLSEDPKLNS